MKRQARVYRVDNKLIVLRWRDGTLIVMADDSFQPVHARPGCVHGNGRTDRSGTIADLQQRRVQADKLGRKSTGKVFAAVLGKGRRRTLNEADLASASDEAEEEAPLPRAPRPALSHPAQRGTFGRDDDQDSRVILKG